MKSKAIIVFVVLWGTAFSAFAQDLLWPGETYMDSAAATGASPGVLMPEAAAFRASLALTPAPSASGSLGNADFAAGGLVLRDDVADTR
jgi:hypothetical protein